MHTWSCPSVCLSVPPLKADYLHIHLLITEKQTNESKDHQKLKVDGSLASLRQFVLRVQLHKHIHVYFPVVHPDSQS